MSLDTDRLRLNYMDNMRAFAFSMMLLFHTFKLFTPQGWGIHLTPIPGAHFAAEFISSWRLPILFFISGSAFSISIRSKNIFNRTAKKLLPMLLIGTPILVSFANFLHDRYTDPDTALWPYFRIYISNLLSGKFSWYHLWYLGYILFFVAVHQLLHSIRGRIRLRSIFSNVPFVLALLIFVTLINETYLRPIFPLRRNFYSDIASIISFSCFYIAGAATVHRIDLLKKSATLLTPLLILAMASVALHFVILDRPTHVTRMLVSWTVVFAANGLFIKFLNIKFKLTTLLHEKLMEIYVIHQITILAAVFMTIHLNDGYLKILIIFISAFVLAYVAGVAKSVIKDRIKLVISRLS